MTTDAAARIRQAERARITSIVDARIAEWEQFQADFDSGYEIDLLLAELDLLKERISDVSTPNRRSPLQPQD